MQVRGSTLAIKSKADKAPLPGIVVSTAEQFRRGEESRYVLYPKPKLVNGAVHQRVEFAKAINTVWEEGRWCIYFDELFYITKIGLGAFVDMLLTQGRSNDITVVCGMQRPVGVTRYAMSQATHLIAFRGEDRDIRILDEIGGREWAKAVAKLQRYEFAWYYRPDRKVWTGKVQDLLAINPE